MLEKTLEQTLEQCLEKRMDGSCRSHPPYESDLLLWTGKTYDPTTHQIKSRISPQYNLTLKQGLVAKGNGSTSKISYGVKNPCDAGCTLIEVEYTLVSLGSDNNAKSALLSNYDSSQNKRGFAITRLRSNSVRCLFGKEDGTFLGAVEFSPTNKFENGDIVKIALSTTATDIVVTVYKNGAANGTGSLGGQNKIYSNGAEFILMQSALDYSDQKICNLTVKIGGVLFLHAPLNGTSYDIVNGWSATNTDITWERSDYATFRSDEYGFAVKSGAIYPKLLDGSGYAGLVGEPDAVYHGLIATKGQPEIGTKQYLGTEYDFGDAVAITDAGISWDDWYGEDANGDTVGTAETDLDTDYYNAITANLMTNTSIAGYAGTSNVKSRLFFKVADRVMKDDGSFLAESGRVQEILVYKRDLSASEILRVQKYCREVV
jgi:hypothetical protein